MDDPTVSALRFFWGCVLDMFSERFSIDLVLIPMRGSKFIIRMDWLGPNGVVIDCEQQLVRVRTLSGGELVVTSERSSQGPTLCLAARARRYL